MFERLTAVIWWYHEELDGFEKPVYDNEADFLNDIASAVNMIIRAQTWPKPVSG